MGIRDAWVTDLGRLTELDHVTRTDPERLACIRRSIEQGSCIVCTESEEILGYGVLEYSFYGMGFVAMLYVNSQHRRQGVGSQLMRELEKRCRTSKIFTSTNLSNLPMQSLLRTLAYRESGIIFNLDPGDPELVYLKVLRADTS